MRYDFVELARRVKEAKGKFVIKLLAALAVIVGAIVACVMLNNEVLIIPTALIVIVMVLLIARLVERNVPKGLFTPELRGVNLKEEEYAAKIKRPVNVGYPKARMVTMPHTFANRKAPPLVLNGTVYLRLDDGNIKIISRLYKAHMDIYQEGDVLLKPHGTKFPIVLNREVKEQPCPICGEVNEYGNTACSGCGLGITYDDETAS